ncbi:hypothetical protein IWW56_001487 [Coemansia sp. RSA 2131]|nr:hypothetical protein IWW56_001487 [Coemansia sp. RSA 2131]
MEPYFFPALWEQRRICIAQTLYEHRVQSVLEVGCGEGNVVAFLVSPSPNDEHPITRLCGIDIKNDALDVAYERLQPNDDDKRDLRVDPLNIQLFHGDASVPVPDLSVDAVVCTEVIEHVDEQVGAPALTHAVLGGYNPLLAVFTTPNAEFNVNFPGLAYGTPDARFRDDDHKFEWTREQFRSWAESAASKYGYTVEIRGIGLSMRNPIASFEPYGGCTQMAVFTRNAADSTTHFDVVTGSPPRLHASAEYPVFTQPQLNSIALRSLVRKFALDICNAQQAFQLDELWDILEIKQQFKRCRMLEKWLDTQTTCFASQTNGLYTVKT